MVVTAPTEPPDPLAQLDHCIRAHPGTEVTPQEREALRASCASMPPAKVQALLWKLWGYWKAQWKAGGKPSVSTFLGSNAQRAA
jgi:hypothetical protein